MDTYNLHLNSAKSSEIIFRATKYFVAKFLSTKADNMHTTQRLVTYGHLTDNLKIFPIVQTILAFYDLKTKKKILFTVLFISPYLQILQFCCKSRKIAHKNIVQPA